MFARRFTALLACLSLVVVGCADAMNDGGTETETTNAPSFGSAVDGKGDQLDEPIDPEKCPGGAPRTVDGDPATWTLIIWSAGDNNLEEALVDDINQMERGHTGSPNVNVLVQLDRESEDGSWRYEIQPGDDPDEIESKLVGHSDEELDSGNWKNYAAFGEWATVCYPAQQYMSVIEGHGGGWSPPEDADGDSDDEERTGGRTREEGDPPRLIAPDDTNGTEMSMPDLKRALAHIRESARREGDPTWRNRLKIYGSDACLMQTVEVLKSLTDTARFIVGSAELEPGPGWPYYTVIEDLTTRPYYYAQTPRNLAEAVVDNYGKSYGSRGGQADRTNYTLAVADGRHVDDVVGEFDDVTDILLESTDQVAPHLETARQQALVYDNSEWSPGVYVDTVTLLEELRAELIEQGMMPAEGEHWDGDEKWRTLREEIDAVLEAIDSRVLTDATFGPDVEQPASGLSIFAPETADSWRMEFSKYTESRFAQKTDWDEVIDQVFVD